MNTNEKINVLAALGDILNRKDDALQDVLYRTETHNKWFTQFHLDLSLQNFTEHYLHADALKRWAQQYDTEKRIQPKNIGLILAGNIPFVGMHDVLCVLMSGNKAKIKLSSKDMFFYPYLYKQLVNIDQRFENTMEFSERLEDFDAVIATGSNNSARYFEYYFGKYPHIIRKNRTSVAILQGDETDAQLAELGKDIFYYYGLGCRNVGKLYLPADFEIERLFRIWEPFHYVIENNKYKNNFDYNRTILLLNQVPHLANDFFMLVEENKLFSPLSTVYYESYENITALQQKITQMEAELQCVVSDAAGNTDFGKTQFPELNDYADHVDTMMWLQEL